MAVITRRFVFIPEEGSAAFPNVISGGVSLTILDSIAVGQYIDVQFDDAIDNSSTDVNEHMEGKGFRFVEDSPATTIQEASDAAISAAAGSGSLPAATLRGQILFSIDGSTFTVQSPTVDATGWLADAQGELLVDGH